MVMSRLVPIALCLALAGPAFAKGPPQPLPDWPCETPLAGPLEPDMLWPGAGARPDGAWHEDPAARHLVEFLTAGENSPAMGQREIEEFTAQHGPVEPETALLVVSGMVERGNVLRRVLLKGIKDQIIKSHVLADAVAAGDAKIDAAEKQGSADARQQAATLKEARRFNLAGLGDANDTAERLCHRLVHDETKLRTLAVALRAHTRRLDPARE